MTTAQVLKIEKCWLTTTELMKYTGWSRDYIRTLRDMAKLHFYKPCGEKMTMYKLSEVDRLIERSRVV